MTTTEQGLLDLELSYTWTVDDLSYESRKVGDVVVSPVFTGGMKGYSETCWKLLLYPKGTNKYDEEHFGLFLELVSSHWPEIQASFKLSFLNLANTKIKELTQDKHVFSLREGRGGCLDWGFHKFITYATLQLNASNLLNENKLKINCSIWGFSNPSKSAVQLKEMPKPDLSQDMWQQYVDKKFVDVTVSVKDRKFWVHKCVLAARSPVFATMFEQEMLEKSQNLVTINDCEPNVFSALIRYMYLGIVEHLSDVDKGLLVVAEKYDLEGLKSICERSINSTLSVDNVFEVLDLADLHRAPWLKRQALDYLKTHARDIDMEILEKLVRREVIVEICKYLMGPGKQKKQNNKTKKPKKYVKKRPR